MPEMSIVAYSAWGAAAPPVIGPCGWLGVLVFISSLLHSSIFLDSGSNVRHMGRQLQLVARNREPHCHGNS